MKFLIIFLLFLLQDGESLKDTSLSTLMEPVLKVTENSKLCLKKTNEIDKILDNIEDAIKNGNIEDAIKNDNIEDAIQNGNFAKVVKGGRSCADARHERERSYGLGKRSFEYVAKEIFPFGQHSHYHSHGHSRNNSHLHSDHGVEVLCDLELDGGGWTVIQMRRADVPHRENFDRPWQDYVEGFGSINTEYWIGLDVMHELTSRDTELHVALEDWEGNTAYARYSTFRVGSPSENYKLTISGYSGTAKDSMTYIGDGFSSYTNNGMSFTTYDRDNDTWRNKNCAKDWTKGGWWYNHCTRSNLNGPDAYGITQRGIYWMVWKGNINLLTGTMKIRPKHLYG